MTERHWRAYFRRARKYLYCTRREQQIFEQRIRDAVRELKGEQPGITFAQCVEILGTPEQAAREYMEDFSPAYIAEQRRWRTLYHNLLLGGVLVLLLVLVFYAWYVRSFSVVIYRGLGADGTNSGYEEIFSGWDAAPPFSGAAE